MKIVTHKGVKYAITYGIATHTYAIVDYPNFKLLQPLHFNVRVLSSQAELYVAHWQPVN